MSNLSNNSSPQIPSKDQVCAIPVQGTFVYLLVLLIFVMIVTFAGNLLVIFAVIFFRRLRSITNYFIFSLAVSDLLISLLSLPFRIDQNIHNGHWCLSLVACQTWITVDTICTFASMWNLAIISIDRFIAIKLPFQYHSRITIKVCIIMITCVWAYSTIMTLLMFTDNWTFPGHPRFGIRRECSFSDRNYSTVTVSLSFFTPLVIILVMYGMVFEVAVNQTRAMAALQVDLSGRGRGGRRSSVNFIREVKAAKTLAIVVGCFIVCWLPFNVIFLILIWQPALIVNLSQETRLGIALTFIYVLPALNSTMNPVIYALFNREFRSAFLRLFRRIAGQRMGAIGYGGAMDSSSAVSTIREETIKHPSKTIQFKEYDIEHPSNALPAIPQNNLHSYTNDAYTEHTTDDNLNIRHVTYSMDDDKKSKSKNTTAPAQNGHVTDDITQNDVSESNNDVIDDDIPGTPKMAMAVKLPPLQRDVSLSESDHVQAVKPTILPPITGHPQFVVDSVNDDDDDDYDDAKMEVLNTAL